MKQYEYMFLNNVSNQQADRLGALGWELVGVVYDVKYSELDYFFKREIVT